MSLSEESSSSDSFLHEEESEFEDNFDDEDDEQDEDPDPLPLPSRNPVIPTPHYDWNVIEDVEDPSLSDLDLIPNYSGKREVIGFENLDPHQCFLKFFPEKIFEIVSTETNRYAEEKLATKTFGPKSRFSKWNQTTPEEIKAFIASEIGMGLVQKPALNDYFQDSYWLTKTPGFSMLFSRDRYQLIRSFIHFENDNGYTGDDRLKKIRTLIDETKDTYMASYTSNTAVSIDETMIKFKGRLFWKQYIPTKPKAKWGIKVWSLCDAETGFLMKFRVYVGKEGEQGNPKGLAFKVVDELLEDLKNKGHILYVDNFYSGVPLFDHLRENKTGACGTVRINRKGLPPSMKSTKLIRGSLPIIWEREDKKMLACSWQDTGRVNMISTVGNPGVTNVTVHTKRGPRQVKKPKVQRLYNTNMGGVDRFDQLCANYSFDRRYKKWYQVLWHFLIEVALVNGYICYNEKNPKITQKQFRELVIDGLIKNYVKTGLSRKRIRLSDPLKKRLADRHFPDKMKQIQKNCVVCSVMPSACEKKGKGICKRARTSFFCKTCEDHPPLCITPCFELYHTKERYKNTCKCLEVAGPSTTV